MAKLKKEFFVNIKDVDIYCKTELEPCSFVPKMRFYHITEFGKIQYFKCEYNFEPSIKLDGKTQLKVTSVLRNIIEQELSAEIERYLKT